METIKPTRSDRSIWDFLRVARFGARKRGNKNDF